MWRCKKCGERILALVIVNTTFEFNVGELGHLIGYNDDCAEDRPISKTKSMHYYCSNPCCGFTNDNNLILRDIADWVEEEE